MTTQSAINDVAPVAGNANLLISGIPPQDTKLAERVEQYLNARSASLLDVTDDAGAALIVTRFASTSQLHLVSQPLGARRQLTFAREPVTSARMLPGDPNQIILMQDKGGSENYQIMRLDLTSGRYHVLSDGTSRHSLPVLSRDGRKLAFSNNSRNGRDTDVYLASTPGPDDDLKSAIRATETTGTWAPVQFSPDNNLLLIQQYRAIDDSDLVIYDSGSGSLRQISADGEKAGITDAAFSADGKSVYIITDRYSDFSELIQVPVDGATSEPRFLSRSIPWNVEGIEVAPDGSRVALAVNEDGMSRIFLLDPDTGNLESVTLPPGIVGSMRFARNNTGVLTFAMDSAQSPSDVFQLNLKDKTLTRWTQSEAGGLNTEAFSPAKLVRYPSTDGVEVPAFYYPAKADAGSKAPVVVIFHGGPEGQSRPNFSPFVQLLTQELGLAVLLPNVRGSDGYGKKYLSLDNGVKREDSLKDIGATLDWVAAQPELDADRVAVYGGSYGGYMVLATAVFYPERIKAVVDVVGISNIATFLQNTQDYRRDLRRAEYGDERVPEVREVLERISPLNHVSKIKAALYVQQGKNDPRVPQSEAEQIVQAVRDNGLPCWYMLALNEGHGFAKKENRDWALISTVQFLRDQLLQPKPPPGTKP